MGKPVGRKRDTDLGKEIMTQRSSDIYRMEDR